MNQAEPAPTQSASRRSGVTACRAVDATTARTDSATVPSTRYITSSWTVTAYR